jgi:hypothetical protein
MFVAVLLSAATLGCSTNLRRRTTSMADPMLEKPKLFAIQAPEGPNIFHPESLPVWMRPTAPGGDGSAAQIGAASSTETPTSTDTKASKLQSKFGGDYSSSSSQSNSQLQEHHSRRHRRHHHLHHRFQEAGEGETSAAPAAPAAPASGGIPVDGIAQGAQGGAPTMGPLAPTLPEPNNNIGMLMPAGGDSAPQMLMPPNQPVDTGKEGTTPFHISTNPVIGLASNLGGPPGAVFPGLPGAGVTFK